MDKSNIIEFGIDFIYELENNNILHSYKLVIAIN